MDDVKLQHSLFHAVVTSELRNWSVLLQIRPQEWAVYTGWVWNVKGSTTGSDQLTECPRWRCYGSYAGSSLYSDMSEKF